MKKTNSGAALVAALLLALVAVSCDRDRSNPLDPQSDFEQNRPDAPAQLAAVSGVGVIRLAWQAGTDRDLAGYAVFRAERSNGTYSFVVGDGDSTAGITTGKVVFADSIRTQNLTYFYRVAAIDTAGLQSELTSFVGATALEDNVSPESPQSLSAVSDEDVVGRVTLPGQHRRMTAMVATCPVWQDMQFCVPRPARVEWFQSTRSLQELESMLTVG